MRHSGEIRVHYVETIGMAEPTRAGAVAEERGLDTKQLHIQEAGFYHTEAVFNL